MKKMNKPTWIAIILIVVLVLVCLVFILKQPRNSETAVAHILVEGQEYRSIDLKKADDQTFSIEEDTGKKVSFQIGNHRIRFVNVECPDHICEGVGYIYSEGQTAICLPNKVVLVVEPD